MKHAIDRHAGIIIVPARLLGPSGDRLVRLALDTGASTTLIGWSLAVQLGYDPAASPRRTRVTMASGVEYCPMIVVDRLQALGKTVRRADVVCHNLPPSSRIDGLLGLSFLSRFDVRINFRLGFMTLR